MAEANQQAPKEADKKNTEQWLSYLALTTVVFAVCATLSTFKGGGFSTKSMMSQSQASDQWAFYQSKSIKSYLYQLQQEKIEMDMVTLPNDRVRPETIAIYTSKIAGYKEKIAKYEKEKLALEAKAKQLEQDRDEAKLHSTAFGMAVIFLQISILLSSIAALLKRKPIWYTGIVAGVTGILYFADGFFVFM